MNNHVMLDLETLGTSRNSVILSIGAVRFDPTNADSPMDDIFYCEFNGRELAQQQRLGMHIDSSTVAWWMQQNILARRVFEPGWTPAHMDNIEALQKFEEFLHEVPETQVWGNGADFDNILLGDMYTSFEVSRPWSYRQNRCYRTLRSLPGCPKRLHHAGIEHNARDDAITQAQHLQEIFQWLRLTK